MTLDWSQDKTIQGYVNHLAAKYVDKVPESPEDDVELSMVDFDAAVYQSRAVGIIIGHLRLSPLDSDSIWRTMVKTERDYRREKAGEQSRS